MMRFIAVLLFLTVSNTYAKERINLYNAHVKAFKNEILPAKPAIKRELASTELGGDVEKFKDKNRLRRDAKVPMYCDSNNIDDEYTCKSSLISF